MATNYFSVEESLTWCVVVHVFLLLLQRVQRSAKWFSGGVDGGLDRGAYFSLSHSLLPY